MQDANAPGKLVHCLCSSHKASIMNRKRGPVKWKQVRSEPSNFSYYDVCRSCTSLLLSQERERCSHTFALAAMHHNTWIFMRQITLWPWQPSQEKSTKIELQSYSRLETKTNFWIKRRLIITPKKSSMYTAVWFIQFSNMNYMLSDCYKSDSFSLLYSFSSCVLPPCHL